MKSPTSFKKQFQKISIPSPWMVTGNSEGGSQRPFFFKGKQEANLKLEFPKRWGGGFTN